MLPVTAFCARRLVERDLSTPGQLDRIVERKKCKTIAEVLFIFASRMEAPCDPDRAAFKIFLRPGLDTSLEDICGCTRVTKPRSNTFAEFLALLANRDDDLSGKARRPFRDIGMAAPHRARNEVGSASKSRSILTSTRTEARCGADQA